jgi:hypothetical protein
MVAWISAVIHFFLHVSLLHLSSSIASAQSPSLVSLPSEECCRPLFSSLRTIRSFSFHLEEKRKSCQTIRINERGYLQNITLLLPADLNTDEALSIQIKTDSRHCLSYHSKLVEGSENDCVDHLSGVLSWRQDDESHRIFQDLLLEGLHFDEALEICLHSFSPIDGQMTFGFQHPLPSASCSTEGLLFPRVIKHSSSPVPEPEHAHLALQLGVISSITVPVTSLTDSPANSSSCDPSILSSSSQCNLRSAFSYCNLILISASNSTCVIEISAGSQIMMNMSLGSVVVEADSGELFVMGNGCEISSLPSSQNSTFLRVWSESSNRNNFHFQFMNSTIKHFGHVDESGGALYVQNLASVVLNALSFVSNLGYEGGALYAKRVSYLELDGCSFTQNSLLTISKSS